MRILNVFIIISTLFSGISFAQIDTEQSSGADYFCSDGEVIVEIFKGGPIPEEFDFDSSIFKNNHIIKITTQNNVLEFTDFVISTSDGAGQESYQVFVQDRLAPLKMVVDFYFEHEGGYLVGSFLEILNFAEEGVKAYNFEFGDTYQFDEDMKCKML